MKVCNPWGNQYVRSTYTMDVLKANRRFAFYNECGVHINVELGREIFEIREMIKKRVSGDRTNGHENV